MNLKGLFSRREAAPLDPIDEPLDPTTLKLVELITESTYTELGYRQFVRELDDDDMEFVTARFGELHGRFVIELERRDRNGGCA